jgi:beta-N-acetylhexosaminidase
VLRRLRLAVLAASVIAASSGCVGIPDGDHGSGAGATPAASTPPPPSRSPSPAGTGCSVAGLLGTWSLERRAAQLVVVPVEENDVLSARPLVAEGVGGIILFGSDAPPTLPANLAVLQRSAPRGLPALVMTDEEGGGVQRLANLAGNLPWPRTMAATLTVAQTRALAERIARGMRAAGVTMDLAPVLDLSDGPGPDAAHPDGARSFSINASITTAYGLAFAEGMLEGGVIPVVKHFPGLGQASYNSDFGPSSDPPLPVLKAAALRPFETAITAGAPAVMVGNVSVPGLTSRLPAALSTAAITGLLRDQLGFRGLVLTDSLSALAVQDAGYSVPQAAARAIAAGADMVLFNTSDPGATAHAIIADIAAAVTSHRMPVSRLDDAVQHVLAAKNISVCR